MKQIPRIFMLLSVLFLLSLFIMPMWRITLYAPQYPDGISMYIHINKISGETAGTLQNINILNHYVGMKFIEPESIPELKYFPIIMVIMAGLGLLAAFLNNKWFYMAWFILFVLLSIAGIYDFYLWEYDYGHNLSPTAPIKIPGASFQPPVIGTKQIINFTAESYPYKAGWLVICSVVFSFMAWITRKKTA